MRQTIDGAAFQKMILSAAASIEIHKQQINELNVFPVPDGDTGTNMSMTMGAAAAELLQDELRHRWRKAADISGLRHAARRPRQLRRHPLRCCSAASPRRLKGKETCRRPQIWPTR